MSIQDAAHWIAPLLYAAVFAVSAVAVCCGLIIFLVRRSRLADPSFQERT